MMQQHRRTSCPFVIIACLVAAGVFGVPAHSGGEARAAEEYGVVRGIVVDEQGNPVSGARVRALRLSEREPIDPFAPPMDGVTDGRGRFEARLPQGSYLAHVASGPLTSAESPFRTTWWIVENQGKPLDIRIPLKKGRRLRGIVVRKENGQPVPSARVIMENGLPTVADAMGRFEFDAVGIERNGLLVIGPGFADRVLESVPEPDETREVRIEMSRGYRVRGKVTDKEGAPVSKALVLDGY